LNTHPGTANPNTAKSCPHCRLSNKSHVNFLACNNAIIKQLWTEANNELSKALQTHQSDPMLKRLLVHAISYLRTMDNAQIPDFLPPEYHNLFKAQSQIGWSQVLEGRWSTQWVKLHDKHAQRNKSKTNSETLGQHHNTSSQGNHLQHLEAQMQCTTRQQPSIQTPGILT
jgi:hypothetical protein